MPHSQFPGRQNLRSRAHPPVTVQASVTVTLTASQAELLSFLADRGEPPRVVRLTNYTALHTQGLIYLGDQAKYQITELGRQTVRELGPEKCGNP